MRKPGVLLPTLSLASAAPFAGGIISSACCRLQLPGLLSREAPQTKHLGKDIAQSFKTLVGWELTAFNEMMNDERALATKSMVEEAKALGADAAVLNIRYASAAIMQGAAEVIVYGTAVKLK